MLAVHIDMARTLSGAGQGLAAAVARPDPLARVPRRAYSKTMKNALSVSAAVLDAQANTEAS
jgi:hypothetical protein